MTEEGWTEFSDDRHLHGEMAMAAACYALPPHLRDEMPVGQGMYGEGWIPTSRAEAQAYIPEGWPWAPSDWRPTRADRIRELVKAGSLLAAEIDRLCREERG